MNMPASFWTENLLPPPKRLSPESEEDGDCRCEWHSCDQPKRTDQRPHDFLGNKRKVDKIPIISARERKHQQHGERCACISQYQRVDRRRHMILPDSHCGVIKIAKSKIWIRMVKLKHSRGLSGYKIIQHAQPTDDHTT